MKQIIIQIKEKNNTEIGNKKQKNKKLKLRNENKIKKTAKN